MNNLKEKTISGFIWTIFVQIVKQFFQFIVFLILSRLLSPRDFGLMGMILVFAGFLGLFTDVGLSAVVIQRLNLKQQHLNVAFWANVALGIFLSLTLIFSSSIIANFYNEPILKKLIIVFSMNFIISSFYLVQRALLQRNMEFKKLALIDIFSLIFSGLVAVIAAYSGLGVWSLLLQTLTNSVSYLLIIIYLKIWFPNLNFDIKSLKEIAVFSGNLTGFNIFNYWVRNLDNLLIGKFIGTYQLGIYTRAYSLMVLPITQISGVISQVLFPAMSRTQEDIPFIRSVYLRLIRIIGLITFPLMVGLLVSANNFVLALLGKKWEEMILVLRILSISGIMQGVGSTVGLIYTSQGRTDLMFKWGIFSGIIYILSFIIGLRWGIIGVALAYVLSGYIILWYPAWTIPGKLINITFFDFLKNLKEPLLCSIAMGIIVYIIEIIIPQHWDYGIRLVLQVSLGIVIYIIFLIIFKVEAYKDILKLIKELLLKYKKVGK